MELLNRYLYAVRHWLPSVQRDDIIAEIADDLHATILDRETVLGRPLGEEELAGILKQRGKPQLVAGQYLQYRTLIGPTLLPAYWFLLKLVVLWILVPVFVLVVGPVELSRASNPALVVLRTGWYLLMSAVFAIGAITIGFAVAERQGSKRAEDWDPRRLPPVPAGGVIAVGTPRYLAIIELSISIGLSLGWLLLMWYQPRTELERVLPALAPIWTKLSELRVPILALLLSGIPVAWCCLTWPSRTRLRHILRLAINTIGLVLICLLLQDLGFETPMSLFRTATGDPATADWNRFGIVLGLYAVAIIVLADSAKEASGIGATRRLRVPPAEGR